MDIKGLTNIPNMVYFNWRRQWKKSWILLGSSRKNIRAFPEEVKDDIGYALFEAQEGKKPTNAKSLKRLRWRRSIRDY